MKKKITSIFLVLAMLLVMMPSMSITARAGTTAVSDTSWYTEYTEERGSAENPYIINDVADLEGLAQLVNLPNSVNFDGEFIKLSDNFDSTGELTTPIGAGGAYFVGTFDGNSKTIKLNISKDTVRSSLFGSVEYGGTVKNVTTTGKVAGSSCAGGVVGYNNGTVQNCCASGEVKGSWCVGGVVGYNDNDGKVQNCYATGQVADSEAYAGGVVGDNMGNVENCYALGEVTCTSAAGGVVGANEDIGTVQNCYATGKVAGSQYAGGVVGDNSSTVENCYATGKVTGSQHVGGVVGRNNSEVQNCYFLSTENHNSDMLASGGGGAYIEANTFNEDCQLSNGGLLLDALNDYVKSTPTLFKWKKEDGKYPTFLPTCEMNGIPYPTISAALIEARLTAERMIAPELYETTITLISDVTDNVNINFGQNITIDLNGYVLQADVRENDPHSVIINEGTLTIKDSNPTAEHKFAVDATTGLWKLDETNGTKTVTGGCITGGTDYPDGYSIDIPGIGKFEPFTRGGGINNLYLLFIQSGNIVGNTAGVGGAIYNDGVTIITGGKILGNRADMTGGILNKGILNIANAEIAYNTAYEVGGIYSQYCDCHWQDDSEVSSKVGDINLQHDITLGDGTVIKNNITDDETEKYPSAGAYIYSGTAKVQGKVIIKDNKTLGKNANLSVCNDAQLMLNSLATGSVIGVSKLNSKDEIVIGAFTDNAAPEDANYFLSDNDAYCVKYVEASGEAGQEGYIAAHLELAEAPKKSHSSGGSTITAPVIGDKETVKVQVNVSGTNVTIKDVTKDEITKVGVGKEVTLDLTNLNKTVTGVTIPKTTFENVAKSGADGLEVKLPNGTKAVFDKTTLKSVVEQAEGDDIKLVVDKETKAEQSMNTEQKEAVKQLNKPVVLDAYFVSNGTRISNFKGGEAEIAVVYPTEKPVRVWYIADDGSKELVPSSYDGKTATFTVTHFSHYVIEQIEQEQTIENIFVDIFNSDYYYNAVMWASKNGITSGMDATHFEPFNITTRGQMVTFLWRAAGSPEPTDTTCAFTDVSKGSYYEKAVLWAIEKGIVKGITETTFAPDMTVTRGQAVTLLARNAGITDEATGYSHNFTDVKATDYYNNAVSWAATNDITKGMTETSFAPNQDCTRAQIVTFLYRALNK